MRRDGGFHEILIPVLVKGIGAESYLEFGTANNETIRNVPAPKRYGVDPKCIAIADVHMFQMTTAEFIANHAAQYAPFDVVFIDADHRKDAVMNDFMGIWPHVSPEGLILFHDTNPETMADTDDGACSDSWKFAWTLCGHHEAVTLPYHPGLTILRKRMTWGPQ